jgi:predicted glycogen debranching enzyme
MLLVKDNLSTQNFSSLSQMEWLQTNGLGGWASSSITGCHTRRYHGLLMASILPPAQRMLLVSKLDETILQDGKKFELGTNDYGDAISPGGFQYLQSFRNEFFPEWIYEMEGIRLRKTVTMVQGENSTLIRYEVLKSEQPFTIEFLTLIAARGYHQLQHAYNNIFWDVEFNKGVFHNQPYQGAPDVFISVPGSRYTPVNKWYYRFTYEIEKYRGLDYQEDLFNHGLIAVDLKEGDVLDLILSTENPTAKNAKTLWETEKNRKIALLLAVPGDLQRQLVLAADQFIVKRNVSEGPGLISGVSLKTVIAGYHWFTDWGRDTMIALPGLCFQTGRFEDAKKIISVFAKSVSMGMLPNRFTDNNDPPEYNNVDGTLWYFNAVYAYWQVTGDQQFVLREILPVLRDIVDWHLRGTRFNIHADTDGLLYAGQTGQQLTWMDARVGNWVVTPRMGKPVEIQALWFNALKIFQSLLIADADRQAADISGEKAAMVKKSFEEKYWYGKGNYLYDNLDENGLSDFSLRPNQIFAVSLPFPLIEGEKALAVLETVYSKLLTPMGLRSLSADDPNYKGHYGGSPLSRDGAYHQGTVWSWLLGPLIDAGMKVKGENFRVTAQKIIDQFAFHLNEACIGSVSEIFDGDPPFHPRGCVAQAWSVSEILRVIKTYSLFHAGS